MQVGFAIHLLQLDHLTDRVRYGAIQRIVTQLPVPMSIRERVSIGAAVVGVANMAVVVFARCVTSSDSVRNIQDSKLGRATDWIGNASRELIVIQRPTSAAIQQ